MESRQELRLGSPAPGASARGRAGVRWVNASWHQLKRVVIGVGAGAALLYAPTLGHGFIYDDYWTVVGNRFLDSTWRSLARSELSGRAIELGVPDATRPVMTWSSWLDRMVFDIEPAGHHFQSILLYGLVCALAVLVGFALLRSLFAALVVGACFAVMPLHAEAVAAVNYREDLLCAVGLFGATAALAWPLAGRWTWQVVVVTGGWLMALLSKESAVVWPLMVAGLLIDPGLRPRVLAALRRCWVPLCVTGPVAWP